jgi:hypothetical protein
MNGLINHDIRGVVMKGLSWSLLLGALAIGIGGCGGGNGDDSEPPTAQTGIFVDSPVSGIAYTCGAFSGMTGADGSFDYEPGSTCTFKIGGVTLGSATAAALITPVALVSGAVDESNPTVINIARFVMSLDTDSDPGNGIQISSGASTALGSAALDFSSTNSNFATQAADLVNVAIPGRALASAGEAGTHLGATLLGLLAGHYDCTYTDPAAPPGGTATMDITAGVISGSGTGSVDGAPMTFTLSGNVTTSGSASMIAGSVSTGGTFTGSFKNDGTGSGTWTDGADSGTWACQKA